MVAIETYKRHFNSLKQELEDLRTMCNIIVEEEEKYSKLYDKFSELIIRQNEKYTVLSYRVQECQKNITALEAILQEFKEVEHQITESVMQDSTSKLLHNKLVELEDTICYLEQNIMVLLY